MPLFCINLWIKQFIIISNIKKWPLFFSLLFSGEICFFCNHQSTILILPLSNSIWSIFYLLCFVSKLEEKSYIYLGKVYFDRLDQNRTTNLEFLKYLKCNYYLNSNSNRQWSKVHQFYLWPFNGSYYWMHQ